MKTRYFSLSVASAVAFSLYGCGGSSPGVGIATNLTGQTNNRTAVTAKLEVDTVNNTVTVKPLTPTSRTAFGPQTIDINTAEIITVPGSSRVSRVIKLNLTNLKDHPIGSASGLNIKAIPSQKASASTVIQDPNLNNVSSIWESPNDTIYATVAGAGTIYEITGNSIQIFASSLGRPFGLTGDSQFLYFTDSNEHTVKRIDRQTKAVSIVAGIPNSAGSENGNGAQSRFDRPAGITNYFGQLLIADSNNGAIRAISDPGGSPTVSQFATGLVGPFGIEFSQANGTDYAAVTNRYNQTVSTINLQNQTVANIAPGNRRLTGAGANGRQMAIANTPFASEPNLHQIQIFELSENGDPLQPTDWTLVNVLGDNPAFIDGDSPRFNSPNLVKSSRNGFLVADGQNNAIRRIEISQSTIVDNLSFSNNAFFDATGNAVFKAEALDAQGTSEVSIGFETNETGIFELLITVEGDPNTVVSPDSANNEQPGNLLLSTLVANRGVIRDGPVSTASVQNPLCFSYSKDGSLFFTDGSRIRVVRPDGNVYTIGNRRNQASFSPGRGSVARFPGIEDLAVSPDGLRVAFIIDNRVVLGSFNPEFTAFGDSNNVLVGPNTTSTDDQNTAHFWVYQVIAGEPTAGDAVGFGNVARFRSPTGISFDNAGNILLADTRNNKVKVIEATGTDQFSSTTGWLVNTVAGSGNGSNALTDLNEPTDVAQSKNGGIVIADRLNQRIVEYLNNTVTLRTEQATGIDVDGSPGKVALPRFIGVDHSGTIYTSTQALTLKAIRFGSTRSILVGGTKDGRTTKGTPSSGDIGGNVEFHFAVNAESGDVAFRDDATNGIRLIQAITP